MTGKNGIRAMIVLTLITAGLFAVPSTSLFTGFTENPADAAEDAVTFDGNPADAAVDAAPRDMYEQPRIHQRSRVSANASTNATGDVDASQRTATGVDDHLSYRPRRSFDNIFVRQDARSSVRQNCRVGGSCRQQARTDINQSADIAIQGRFTNVFLTQDAEARFQQHCRADDCAQTADSDISQRADFTGSHWSSNGFVARRQAEYRTQSTGDR